MPAFQSFPGGAALFWGLLAWGFLASMATAALSVFAFKARASSVETGRMLEERKTELERAARAAERLVMNDPETGLPNRTRMEETMLDEFRRFDRYGTVFSAIMLGLDGTDGTDGAAEGPRVDPSLPAIARLIARIARSTDIAGRWDSGRFLILCPSTGTARAAVLAEKLRASIERGEDGPRRTASLGVSGIRSGDLMNEAVKRADALLAESMRGGGNRVVSE